MLFRTAVVFSALTAVALGVTCPQVDNDGTPLSSTNAEGIITCNYPCQYSPDGTLVSGSSLCPKTLIPDESRRATNDEGDTSDLGDGSDNPDNSTTFGAATCPAKIGDAAWTDASIQGDTLTCSYGTDTQCQFSELGKLTSGSDGCPQLLAIANSTQTVVSCPFSDAEDNVWSTVRVSDTALTCGYDGGSTCKYKSDGSLSKKKKKSKKSKQDNDNDTRAASSCKPTAVVIQPDSSNNGTSTTTTGTSTATGTTTATGTDTTTTSTDTSTMTNTDAPTTTGTGATPTSTDNSDDNNKEDDSTTTTSTSTSSTTSSTSSTNTFSITPVPTITGPPRPNAALPSIPRGSLAAILFSIALGCILL